MTPQRRTVTTPTVTLCGVTTLASLLLLLTACRSSGAPSSSRDSVARQQLESLRSVFFADGTLPPLASEAELSVLRDRYASGPRPERRELRSFYSNMDLRLLAIRDSDGDGAHDFRISDYYGKFLEGDIDLDGDGIRNSLDVAPYDADLGGRDETGDGAPDVDFADRDLDTIPDHVDWGGPAEGEAASWQQQLFERHGLLLVERGAVFSAPLARSTYDAVTRVFRGPLQAGPLPTLRTIATDGTCLLSPEVDDGTNGMTVPQTQSLLIYRIGADYPPLAQLGLLVHELAHAWQFALDFDDSDPVGENRRVSFPAGRFADLVEPFGWNPEPFAYDPEIDDTVLFTPQYLVYEPIYLFRGETVETWLALLDEIYTEIGDAYLEDPRLAGIVGEYSLSSPWEWHADNLMAYFYLSLEERARERLDPDTAARAIETLRAVVSDAWPDFRYLNFDRDALEEHYRGTFPLDDADLDYFVDHYLGEVIS